MVFSRLAQRMVSRATAVMMVIGMVTVGIAAPAPPASAAGTVLFNQPFHDNTVDGTAGSVSLPAAPSKHQRRLPVGRGQRTPLTRWPAAAPRPMRRVRASFGSPRTRPGLEGGIFASTSVPTSQGLDVTFNSYQYGGNGADGMAFVLAAVDPANPVIALGHGAVRRRRSATRPRTRTPTA